MTHRPSLRSVLPPFLALLLVPACGGEGTTGASGSVPEADARTPVHVDSIFPIEEDIRRFREGMTPVDGFDGGPASMEALVDAFLRRLEAGDVEGVAALAMSRTEFAYLYYPHTIYTAPPYELSPALVWFQQQNRSSRGLSRVLQRYAGKPLLDTGFQCPDKGEAFGPGRIWHGCTVLGLVSEETAEPGAATGAVEERLFGSILEIGGRYRFVSFSNEL
jgi:hypothetical protein